jgi:hypothetical protein
MKRQFEPFQPSKEQLAFFYQQTQELEAYTAPLGSLTMLVEEHTPIAKPENRMFGVTFVIAPESMKFRIRVEGADLYEACIVAKEEAKQKLTSIMAALPKQALLGQESSKKKKTPAHLLH